MSRITLSARIIPAYAGSTGRCTCLPVRRSDHPRIRGEHDRHSGRPASYRGSSPHTRGAPKNVFKAISQTRIIPAYAGSTGHLQSRPTFPEDHPRIRGEHPLLRRAVLEVIGSSPHTRGAHHSRGAASAAPLDHPRIRGEHVKNGTFSTGMVGSSPHTRGALFDNGVCRIVAGIIPAYAGSTLSRRAQAGMAADHPRIRGEHMPWGDSGGQHPGSSPHTRGAHFVVSSAARRSRIIPAYAGSTHRRRQFLERQWDHPRIRGEHAW